MVASAAISGAKKAADNPAGSVFLAVLVGAVLLQGVRNTPRFFEWGWNRVVPFDVTAPIDKSYEAIQITAALNQDVLEGIEQISEDRADPLENFIFGNDVESVYVPGEISGVQEVYRAMRNNLFRAATSRGGSLY